MESVGQMLARLLGVVQVLLTANGLATKPLAVSHLVTNTLSVTRMDPTARLGVKAVDSEVGCVSRDAPACKLWKNHPCCCCMLLLLSAACGMVPGLPGRTRLPVVLSSACCSCGGYWGAGSENSVYHTAITVQLCTSSSRQFVTNGSAAKGFLL